MERKVVTVLFTDVTGSTQLADRLDVEDLREVMSEWFAAIRALRTAGFRREIARADALLGA